MQELHKKCRLSWINITFSTALFSLTLAAIFFILFSDKNEASSPTINSKIIVADFPTVTESEDFIYPRLKTITVTSNEPTASFLHQYPQRLHGTFNKLLASNFKQSIETDIEIKDNKNIELEENTNVEPVEKDISPEKSNNNKKKSIAPAENDKKTENVETASKSGKRVALTFDDGPDPNVTMQILAILKKYDAKATFFMLGSQVEFYPEISISVFVEGHELGNHTWNHSRLTEVGIKQINSEINKTSSIIEEVTGQKVSLFRPPFGAVNNTVLGQTNLPVIMWNVDTRDWEHRDAKQLLSNVKKNTQDGSIILMHDVHQSTADGLDAVLAYLKDEGYSFVTVSALN